MLGATAVPAIRTVALVKRYPTFGKGGQRRALNGVGIEVSAGQILALVGPNGAGKSTLLRILAGLTNFDEGEAWVHGRSATDAWARGIVSYLPDSVEWPPHLCLESFIATSAQILGREAIDSGEALATVGLETRARTRIAECSRGMRQRLNLAWAMLGDPSVLLLDEVFAGLDPRATEQAAAILRQRAALGTAILFTSHYPEQAERMADVMACLIEGKIVFRGDADAVRQTGGWREIFHREAEV
ncbi:MAG TPA: ABC transporter ATP-binding protein [Candidatus Didemnitutus sp.]|nr:ABC transporter ATP-binding protein [Candidatus Didemnitutus sp.]